jgi:hypothetical protein
MKAATISEMKKDLSSLPSKELLYLMLKLAKYKKENKELLSYLLYESGDEKSYIAGIKEEMDLQFNEVNYASIFYAKKTFRKILRTANKYIRYSGLKTTEIEVLMYYCKNLKASKIPIHKSPQMINLYQRQLDKIIKTINGLHEDLQFDYQEELENLSL